MLENFSITGIQVLKLLTARTSSGSKHQWIRVLENYRHMARTAILPSGDKLYIRRTFFSPGDVTGYWIYQIENDASVYYRLSEFQYDKKVYVETLFLQ